jgi:hypothetical protein
MTENNFTSGYREDSDECSSLQEAKDWFEKVRQTCPLVTIRRFFRKTNKIMSDLL